MAKEFNVKDKEFKGEYINISYDTLYTKILNNKNEHILVEFYKDGDFEHNLYFDKEKWTNISKDMFKYTNLKVYVAGKLVEEINISYV